MLWSLYSFRYYPAANLYICFVPVKLSLPALMLDTYGTYLEISCKSSVYSNFLQLISEYCKCQASGQATSKASMTQLHYQKFLYKWRSSICLVETWYVFK